MNPSNPPAGGMPGMNPTIPGMPGGAVGLPPPQFFVDHKKGEVNELKT